MITGHSRRNGFTLVEVLIVVVILGILASIVIPQFTNASDEARSTATYALLKTLRTQIEVYRTHHDGEHPTLAQMWDNLLLTTSADGTLVVDGPYGPYLQQAPQNQYTQSTTIVAIGAGTITDGWEYDETTGGIYAVGFDESTGLFTAP